MNATALHMAVKVRNLDCIRYLIEHGASLNMQDVFGQTALHYAAEIGDIELLTLLLTYNANPNIKDKLGETPLFYAVSSSHIKRITHLYDNIDKTNANTTLKPIENMDTITALVKAGADLHIQEYRNRTLLHLAAHFGDAACVQYLLEHKVDPHVMGKDGQTALRLSIIRKNKDILEIFLKTCMYTDSYLNDALVLAGSVEDLDSIKCLLTYGANINHLASHDGLSILIRACCSQNTNLSMIKFLLDNKADPNLQSIGNGTALFLAVKAQNHELVMLLLQAGANPNISCSYMTLDTEMDSTGETLIKAKILVEEMNLLSVAISCNNLDIITALLTNKKCPADPNWVSQQTKPDVSPLAMAIRKNNGTAIELLLQYDANSMLCLDASNKSALEYARTQASYGYLDQRFLDLLETYVVKHSLSLPVVQQYLQTTYGKEWQESLNSKIGKNPKPE